MRVSDTRGLVAELGEAIDATGHAVAVLGRTKVEFVSGRGRELLARYRVGERELREGPAVLAELDGRRLAARRLAPRGELVTVLLDERTDPHPALTARELEVLELVEGGLTNREIAELLSISARTVQKHLRHVYDKLGVRTRTGAVTTARAGRAPVQPPRASATF